MLVYFSARFCGHGGGLSRPGAALPGTNGAADAASSAAGGAAVEILSARWRPVLKKIARLVAARDNGRTFSFAETGWRGLGKMGQ